MLYDFAVTIAMSTLGAVTNVMMWAKAWRDLTEFEAAKSIMLGIIIGVLYYVMRVEHGLPDDAVSFAVGYSAKDMIEAFVDRLKPTASNKTLN